MGLKWFRKRLQIKSPTKSSSSFDIPGSYRQFSIYESEETEQSSSRSRPVSQSEIYNGNVFTPRAIPVPPPVVPGNLTSPHNPMASLSASTLSLSTSNERKFNSNIPRDHNETDSSNNYLPRPSIDLLKSEKSSGPKVDKTKKIEIRKKKGRAPMPQPAFGNDNNNDNNKYYSGSDYLRVGEIKSFKESQVEI